MPIIVLDDVMVAKLDGADGPVEFCAHDGRRVGFFTPAKPMQHRLQPQVGEEELDRRQAMRSGRPLSEIMADLEKRS